MEKAPILVLLPADESHRSRLAAKAPEAEILYCKPREVTRELLQSAQAVIGNPEPGLLTGSPNLRWLQLQSAGANGYVDAGVLPAGVALTNATGAYGLAVAEHLVATLFALYKNLPLYRDNQQNRLWKSHGKVQSVYGSTILVLGLGDIGGEFAQKVKSLGATVIGVRRTVGEKPPYVDELHTMEALDDLLPRADCVAMALPGTPETAGIMNRERLGKMKAGSVLLNVGRGSAVDTEALCDALEGGRLRGAALDVTDPEPLPPDHRIWGIPGALITPHSSGGTTLEETYHRVFAIVEENLGRYVRGEALKNRVDFQTGYRAL